MSPGKRPSQPRPKPDHSSAPTAARTRPPITINFPRSLMASNRSIGGDFFKTFLDEGGVLDAGKLGVKAVLLEQFQVGAALDNLAVAKDQDLAGIADGAQAMR